VTDWPRVMDNESINRRFAKIERRCRLLRMSTTFLAVCLAIVGGMLAYGFREDSVQRNARFCALAEQATANAVASGAEIDPLLDAAAEAVGCPRPLVQERRD
jgi:hypothetical protein